ncbi:serine/threonine protein phosphatase 2A 57 kDa regulatory subunit B' iota isoform-like [Arachis hypogaea]|nr:serine/threonine protein phosphatase 2A 57 kDa regulatory subunit B' iota isoform-like [Arachis hypogaea]
MFKQFLSKLPRNKKVDADESSQVDSSSEPSSSMDIPESPRAAGKNHHTDRGSSSNAKWASSIFPESTIAGIEALIPFKDVPPLEKMNLFVSKLNLCCVTFDFTDPSKNTVEKDIKRRTLIELVDFVASGSIKFTEPAILAMCRMCAINLFRVFPPNYRSRRLSGGSGGRDGENDDDEPSFDPSWPHLQIVYDLLLKLLVPLVLMQRWQRNTLIVVFETERHNGIAELLEIFGSIISGFALPLKEEHKIFLWRVLIPLHKPKSLGVYYQQLSYCITQFIEKEPKLASTVIRGLLKYWPITNSQKEVMFLGELEEILEVINMVEFQKVMLPLFWRIGCCINSSHFQVAERALFLWNNDHIVNLIAHNRQVILPIILPALDRNCQAHWNQAVLNLTLNVRKIFVEMDEKLYVSCLARFKEEEARQSSEAEKRKEAWKQLEKAAGVRPEIGNTTVLV